MDAGAGFASYQWYASGVLIPGATGKTYTAPEDGVYTVAVTEGSPLRCNGTSLPFNLVSVGVSGATHDGVIKVYPNPAFNVIHIDASIPVSATVIGMDGKEVFAGDNVQ